MTVAMSKWILDRTVGKRGPQLRRERSGAGGGTLRSIGLGVEPWVEMSLEHRRNDRWGRQARQKVQGRRGKGHPGGLLERQPRVE